MATVVSVVVAIIVGGLATPRKHQASRAILLRKTPPDKVWSLIRDVKKYPDWRDDIQSVTASDSQGSTTWTEVGRQGSVSYVATVSDAPARFVARITDEDLSYTGEWHYMLASAGEGTKLVITEIAEVGNPIFRFFGAYVLGHTRTIDAYLRDLAMQFNEQAKPEPVTN